MVASGDKIQDSNHHLPAGQSIINKLCSRGRERERSLTAAATYRQDK